jgi:hypothetical protein
MIKQTIKNLNLVDNLLRRYAYRIDAHPIDLDSAIDIAMNLLMRKQVNVKNCIRIGKQSMNNAKTLRGIYDYSV